MPQRGPSHQFQNLKDRERAEAYKDCQREIRMV